MMWLPKTHDEIHNMPIGLEIDSLVQSFVMSGMPPVGYDIIRDYIPKFSEDISAAWEVVEKIKDWGEGWCPQIYWDDNDGLEPGEWVAEFNKYWKAENDYRHFEAVADTAPLAICRAALLTTIKEEGCG